MKRLLSLAAAASVACSAADAASEAASSRITATPARSLQDGGGYAYLDDLSGYTLRYSSCVRAKIPQENDDDAVDGNVNFYNGRYHAQYQIYATYHVCSSCNECDTDVEYAMDAAEYLQTGMDHFENYCAACQNACRRRLDENNGGQDQVDCNVCSSSCGNYGKDNDNDESAYVECAAGAVDDDGLQLYYGPQCADDGALAIGVFYDEDCTIKTKHDAPDFDYYKFGAVLDGCVDCASGDTCEELYQESFHCVNGNDKQGQDNDMKVCAAVKNSLTTMDYSGVKKRHSGADAFLKVFFFLLVTGLVGGTAFMSYTYFIRHRGERANPILSADDVHAEEMHEPAPGATLT